MLYQLSYRARESTTRIRTENLQIKNVVPPAFAANPSGWRQQVDESFRLDYRNQAGSGLEAPPFHVLPPGIRQQSITSFTNPGLRRQSGGETSHRCPAVRPPQL